MLASHYTISDLIGGFCAVLLFAPLLLSPGYVIGWVFDCFGFRALAGPWRFLAGIPLSIALCPILTYWLGSMFSWPGVWGFYALLFVAWIALLAGAWGHEGPRSWFRTIKAVPRVSWAIAATWLVIALLSLIDLQTGQRLYYSVVAWDYSIRAAITDAITRTGTSPANPFYFLTGPTPLRYHYFWFLACSLVDRMGGQLVDARQAMIGSAVWSGWALIAIVPLYLRFLLGFTGAALRRRSVLAIALFAVTGLDILPTIFFALKGIAYVHMEWWNPHEITSWWGTALWVPHHTAALVTGLTGFLLIWQSASRSSIRQRIFGALLAGIALATMVGTSIDVAFVFALFLTLWTLVTVIKRDRTQALVLVLAGACTIALVVPYLKSLSGAAAAGGSFVTPSVRHFRLVDHWAQVWHLSAMTTALLRFLALPLTYFLELGFFLVVGIAYAWLWRNRRPVNAGTVALAVLMGTSIFLCTFLRSGVISNNDLGMRGFLPAQFVLLLWAADIFGEGGERAESQQRSFHGWWLRSVIWAPVIFLGLAGTVYEIGILRFNGILADAGIFPVTLSPDRQLGRRTYALRQAYDELKHVLPAAGVVENNPKADYYDFFYGLYAERQTAAYGPNCGAEFGGDPKTCMSLYPSLASIFADPGGLSPEQVHALCRRTGIDAIILKDLDRAWKDRKSWAWQLQPVISTNYARVYLFSNGNNAAQLNSSLIAR
jgi:hypothetical protein